MNKPKPAIVESGGKYLGDVDTSSAPQLELAKSVIRNVREAELIGGQAAKAKADAIYAQYQDSALSTLERRQLAPMVGSAIRIIQKVGAISDDADMFAHKNGRTIATSSARSLKSGVYSLATQATVFEIDDTPAPEAA